MGAKVPNLVVCHLKNFAGGRPEEGTLKFGVEIGNSRRALSVIKRNLVGGHPYPCVISKRPLIILRNGVCNKNHNFPAHRPVTRKFASQMGSSHHLNQEGIKKPKPSTGNFTVWEDSQLTDVEEYQSAKDQHVPMSLEQAGVVLDENNQMGEIEMEDIFEEPIIDIDSSDANNSLAAVEYVEDLYAYYRKMEICSCVPPNYMANQCEINDKMRSILIDWLIEVHYKFELRDETLFLTVNLIDRFLAKQTVVRKKLQLVGLVAMLLACKYEEVSVPVVDDLVFISDKAYTRKEVLEMEKLMLSTLQFNMSVPTPYVFVKRFLKAAQSDRKLPLYILLNVLSMGIKQWNKTCEWHTSYSEDQLLECSKLIEGFHQKAATGKLTAVHSKYGTSKFGFAAKCEPANFIVEGTQQ